MTDKRPEMACPFVPAPPACEFSGWIPGRLYIAPDEANVFHAVQAFGCPHCGRTWNRAGELLPENGHRKGEEP